MLDWSQSGGGNVSASAAGRPPSPASARDRLANWPRGEREPGRGGVISSSWTGVNDEFASIGDSDRRDICFAEFGLEFRTIERREVGRGRGPFGKGDHALNHVPRLVGHRRLDAESVGRPRVPPLRSHHRRLANRRLSPLANPLDLVFEDQRFEVEVLVLRHPTNLRHASATFVGLKDQRGGRRIDDHLHAGLDRLIQGGGVPIVGGHRPHREPVFAVLGGAEGELAEVGTGPARGLPVNPGVLGNPELDFLELAPTLLIDVERYPERSILVIQRRRPRRGRPVAGLGPNLPRPPDPTQRSNDQRPGQRPRPVRSPPA